MTQDEKRQGMAELLAKQRADLPLTPSEAARQRRSRQVQDAPSPGSAGSSQELPSTEEDLPLRQPTGTAPAAAGTADDVMSGQARPRVVAGCQ